MQQLWVFDGDDTLWFVEPLYDQARAGAAQVVADAGLNPQEWEARQRKLDVENVAVYGVSRLRFPTSCVQAYEAEAMGSGQPVDPGVADSVRHAAEKVFRSTAPVHPDARRVVETMRSEGRTVLLTKGDQAIQEKRIDDAGLRYAFDDVRIVSEKDEKAFLQVLHDHAFEPEDSWSIGNSLLSDINPALRIEMNAVWIDAHVWEYERSEAIPHSPRVRIVHDLRDVPFQTMGRPLSLG